MGDKRLSGIAGEDIGKCAYGIFKKGNETIGKTIGIAGEHLTGDQMATAVSKVFGISAKYNAVTPDAFRAFGFPGAEDLGKWRTRIATCPPSRRRFCWRRAASSPIAR
jgi:hypothetical protein